jgi:tRNA threonylcarbamoyl adenosine modification protein YeaZ
MTRILAIDCATEACSVALFDGPELVAHDHQILGRGHAERLVPTIARLPNKGRADEIRVSLGPGSFTGVRIGIAAARALAFAWQAKIVGYPTLSVIAATARLEHGDVAVLACMTGGHGEWFVQSYDSNGLAGSAHASLPPSIASARFDTAIIAGSQADAFVAERGSGIAMQILPDARHAMAIPASLLTDNTAPIYGRAPDAKLPS